MRRPLAVCLFLALCATVAPGFAGNVYIPIVGAEIAGVTFKTEVTVSNATSQDAQFTTWLQPLDTDGTDLPGDGETILLLAGRTVVLAFDVENGLLVVDTAPQLIYSARVIADAGGGESVGTELPVVTADNLVSAGSSAHLQGWLRGGDRITDFGMVNAGQEARCTVSLFRAGGGAILANAEFPWQAVSYRQFPDALGLLGVAAVSDVRLEVTCDQPFYPFALVTDRRTGEMMSIEPSGLGASSIPTPGAPFECPAGSVCFENPSVFHAPTPNRPVHRESVTPPAGTYRRVRAIVRVFHGGWFASRPQGLHNIFWMVKNARNRDMFGYVNVRGPNVNDVFIRHGFNLTQEQKPRIDRPLVLNPGATYIFEYIYDMGQRFLQLTVSDDFGNVLATLGGVPNVTSVSFNGSQTLDMDFGFVEGLNPNEPPTYGWEYRDLVIELTP